MFNSLRSRLWLTYLVLIGVVLVVMALVLLLYIIRNPRIDRQALERLDIAANVISRQIRENPLGPGEGEGNFPRLEDWFSARVVIVDSDGRETVDSAPEAAEVNWGTVDPIHFTPRSPDRCSGSKLAVLLAFPPGRPLSGGPDPAPGGLALAGHPPDLGSVPGRVLTPLYSPGNWG